MMKLRSPRRSTEHWASWLHPWIKHRPSDGEQDLLPIGVARSRETVRGIEKAKGPIVRGRLESLADDPHAHVELVHLRQAPKEPSFFIPVVHSLVSSQRDPNAMAWKCQLDAVRRPASLEV